MTRYKEKLIYLPLYHVRPSPFRMYFCISQHQSFQVVVLLVDTQGSFDCHSTVRDSSTIFALSTLVSSNQVYNLSRNIKEDDLQHLHLFTEYGRMASESSNGVKPFQKLMFLVRDWEFEYEHSYGIEGGQQLLDLRLKVTNNQAKELQDVRRCILDCFVTSQGFLMPHPGFAIRDPNFRGCLSDLSEEFKEQLLQLIPLILAPENLLPKQINGETVKARDLYHFFKSYVDVFNSNELPHPQSIIRATSEARLLSAVESARDRYRQKMENVCAVDAPCVSHVVLRDIHERTCCEVMETFSQTKGMIDLQDLQTRGDQLKQELSNQLGLYELINEGKIHKLRGNAKKIYEESMQAATQSREDKSFCFHPKDLEEIHQAAIDKALQPFDKTTNSLWIFPGHEEDEHRNSLLMELEDRYRQLRDLNDSNNNAAVIEAREDYFSYLETVCAEQDCLSDQHLDREHENALERALQIFQSKRVRVTNFSEDFYKSLLGKEIQEKFGKIHSLNARKNQSNVAASIGLYRNRMAALVGPDSCALHPQRLEEQHDDAKESALNEFHSKRAFGEHIEETDEYRSRIVEEIQRHFLSVCQLNETNNILAVSGAYGGYCSSMDNVCGVGRMRISEDALGNAHEYAQGLALRIFKEKRFGGEEYNPDTHKEKLNEDIRERLEYYREINARNSEPQELVATDDNNRNAMLVAAGLIATTALTGGSALAAIAGEAMLGGTLATAALGATAFVVSAFDRFRQRLRRN
ncbi:uncharacterized protein LOC113234392 [Hyposmocoma kahamanoa]|uniref:uncharacterized protein LOC113234392 n=1 Tax=Hyposmocoma kahamanoa TaxID=1477025 RepID=UPI000E6D8D43|nr:uncharacterized protein LOC113234392 [Hyposmocoma kahamanoa]